jgi:intracellular septation protein A
MDPRREPALILGLVAAAIQVFSTFVIHLTVDQQGTLNAVAVAVAGIITGILVKSDQLAPMVLGLVQAVIAVALSFGWDLAPESQGVVMAFATALIAVIVRHQVTAPIPAVTTTSPVVTA